MSTGATGALGSARPLAAAPSTCPPRPAAQSSYAARPVCGRTATVGTFGSGTNRPCCACRGTAPFRARTAICAACKTEGDRVRTATQTAFEFLAKSRTRTRARSRPETRTSGRPSLAFRVLASSASRAAQANRWAHGFPARFATAST